MSIYSGNNFGEIHEKSLRVLFEHIYKDTPISQAKLTKDIINCLEGWKPRLPIEEFPEDFPDETGYTGDYFTLYRGICFTNKKKYEKFIKEISNGKYKSNNYESWTINPLVALRFANGATIREDFFYKGVVIKIDKVPLSNIFFSVSEAHSELELEYEEWFKERNNERQYSFHEEEMVLYPGEYIVENENLADYIKKQ